MSVRLSLRYSLKHKLVVNQKNTVADETNFYLESTWIYITNLNSHEKEKPTKPSLLEVSVSCLSSLEITFKIVCLSPFE